MILLINPYQLSDTCVRALRGHALDMGFVIRDVVLKPHPLLEVRQVTRYIAPDEWTGLLFMTWCNDHNVSVEEVR